jgi:heterodisulfide reductase subunit C
MSRLKDRNLRPELYGELSELTFGFIGDLEKCMQCGRCVGNCPAASVSNYNPRRLVHSIKLGNIEEIMESEELWSCFFCSSCYAGCPKDINFPFTVAMLRYASLYAGYALDYVKRLLPYALDYYRNGMTVLPGERNPRVVEKRAENTGTSGKMEEIRKRMGLPERRQISEKALSEIQFISDVSGMTKVMKEMAKKDSLKPKTGDEMHRIDTLLSREGKFMGFPGEEDEQDAKD